MSHFFNTMIITSTQNQYIKLCRQIKNDKDFRKINKLFICEGIRLVSSIPDKFEIKYIFISESKENELKYLAKNNDYFVVSDKVFDSITDTKNPSGILVIVKFFDNVEFTDGPILLLDKISDPGNLGSILRSAAARGIYNIILYNCTDVFSPKVIRSSMSGIFFLNIIEADIVTTLDLIKNKRLISLDLNGENIYKYKLENNDCICVGNEANGLSLEIRERTDLYLTIPIVNVESLNAAISVSIALFIL